ncbi:hypothetical protein SAMN05216232_0588 [Virgibacillus subterraneus]|uniref:DUF1878 family protein n=2 Tax=Virgibacillus subterraneus TaxID=621109 RepID=A0A1H8ZWV5_9BACI|nr:hypothetical protein SAMN05216232_0588 [Virgibacillus subterraneus]
MESALYRKELLIFQNHITGTVRAIEKRDSTLMENVLLQISTLETFHSTDLNANRLLSNYEQGVRNLLNSDADSYNKVKSTLNEIFNSLIIYSDEEMNQESFDRMTNELMPLVEQFREETEKIIK